MRLPLEYSSDVYKIRFLSEKDIPEAFELCRENADYYELRKTIPSEENLRFVWKDIPQDADQEAKFFVGYYLDGELVAVLDMLVPYPLPSLACINWFMVKKGLQKIGIGSRIIEELLFFLMENGIEYVRLDTIEEDTNAMQFWRSNGFYPTMKETRMDAASNHITELERQLIFRRQQ